MEEGREGEGKWDEMWGRGGFAEWEKRKKRKKRKRKENNKVEKTSEFDVDDILTLVLKDGYDKKINSR